MRKHMSLAELSAQMPELQQAGPEPGQAANREKLEAVQDRLERAENLKTAILRQMEDEQAPELILYMAIEAIGLLSDDADYIECGQRWLNIVYKDLGRDAETLTDATGQARRLEQMQADYTQKLYNSITRQMGTCRKIMEALRSVQATLSLEAGADSMDLLSVTL